MKLTIAGVALVAAAGTTALTMFFLAPTKQAASLGGGASRTWVSGVGDDANPCSRTAPCKTFAGAISKTAIDGEINCLDPGGFGAVTITKSITIDCHEIFASILSAGTNAINIPFDSFSGTDTAKTVRLRNLNINGFSTGLKGINITGNGAGTEVDVEDMLIDGLNYSAAYGIYDTRHDGGELNISNTTIRDIRGGNTVAGIYAVPAGGAPGLNLTLEHVRMLDSTGYGLRVRSGANAMVSNSSFIGNNAGLRDESPSEVNVDSSIFQNNTTYGIQTTGTIRLSNSDFSFNGSAISGATSSYGTNRISGPVGTAPTPIGAASEARGQQ